MGRDLDAHDAVIMMSGHGTIDTAVEATKFGAMAFLEKPITLQKLLRAVEQGWPSRRCAAPRSPTGRASTTKWASRRSRDDRRRHAADHAADARTAGRAELRPSTARCAKHATRSRRATSSSTLRRKTAA
jgi:DNA-binding NtrC family response regulator